MAVKSTEWTFTASLMCIDKKEHHAKEKLLQRKGLYTECIPKLMQGTFKNYLFDHTVPIHNE